VVSTCVFYLGHEFHPCNMQLSDHKRRVLSFDSIKHRKFSACTPVSSSNFHRSCAPWSDMSHKVTGRGALRKHSTRSGPAASFAIRYVLKPGTERNETTETNETSGTSRNEKTEKTGKSKQNTFSTNGFVSFSSGF
jgi:hypothetical protein